MTESYPILSWAATVATVGLFSTGMMTCRGIKSRGNTENVQFLPIILTAFNCSLWWYYGILKGDSTLVLVNFIGVFLQTLYVIFYFFYTNEKRNPAIVSGLIIFMGLSILGIVNVVISPEGRLNQLGFCCTIVTVLMFGSPLATMANVMKTKSTESMSFPFSFMVFVVSTLWLFYGYAIDDNYVKIPNGLGSILGMVQLSLFCLYKSDKSGGTLPL